MTKRKPIYTASIACQPNAWGLFDYAVHIYSPDFELRTVKTFASAYAAEHYAKQFWSF